MLIGGEEFLIPGEMISGSQGKMSRQLALGSSSCRSNSQIIPLLPLFTFYVPSSEQAPQQAPDPSSIIADEELDF